MNEELYECPKCGKKALYAEYPDEYEVWLKCRECDYFRGMSKAEWHKLKNSPNLEKKLLKNYLEETKEEKSGEKETGHVCRGCKKSFERKDMGPFGFFCKKCWYKFLIVVFVIMVVISYMVWMMFI
ncbi:ssDNA-binding Zn-finger/Zn-ribbon topoisomerase 1 [Methanomicrobium sp. W14]|uniref:hypothetical protein n=1 Tax=Methanomicrobium sp. W14 TaxID=2817839 RepID=UPI001AEA1D1A|nr:hypothetical protein [Methanomicrobium sp. W14]MBP2134281.1 ssDNA-binding Zn-finger/Zn-ribbon topoisomerase 1 [Methanomicrobium sp. W14]